MRKASEARLYALTTTTACLLALLAGVVGAPTRAVMQDLVFDQYQRWKPRPYAFDQPVRVVTVDEESLKQLGQWPWRRERLATLVETLKNAGAAAIVFDFLFAEKDRDDAAATAGKSPDDVFAHAIDGAPVVLGSFISDAPVGPGASAKAGFVTAGDDATKFLTPSPGALAPLSQLAQHAAGVGFLNWHPDADRVVRRVPLILSVDGVLHPSLAMEALRVAQGASTYIVKSSNASGETAFGEVYGVLSVRNGDLTIQTGPSGDVRVYFARPDPRRSIPAWKVLTPGADLSDLKGMIVFVGASAASPDHAPAKPEKSGVGSAAGYHRIGSANSWAFIRAGRYTRRPFQADQLHVDLWWHGLNIARDPGTYLYNGEPPWDNGLAGTAVHNTVMVDGKDQMRRAGRFLWLDWAQASGTSLGTKGSNYRTYFEGEHNGYRRLGVKHRRSVRCVTEDAWVIVDDLLVDDSAVADLAVGDLTKDHSSRGAQSRKVEHDLRLHWLLPNLPFQSTHDEPVAAGLGPATTGRTTSPPSLFGITLSAQKGNFRWHISSSSPGSADIIRSGKNLALSPAQKYGDEALLGWESPTYGERIPAISLLYNVRSSLPVRIVTVILAGEALRLEERSHHLVISEQAAQLYQVNLSAGSESV